jgi:WD40 repeat protein/tRNA A-37 threonylcarbamoyl transferase component Bud32
MSEDPINHPSEEELCALSLGRLGAAQLARVSAHLGDCPECCRRIDRLAATDPLLSRLQQSAAHQEEMLASPTQRRSAVRALRRGHATRSTAQGGDAATERVILPAPKQVGDYEILAEVGRGGMGVVYKARHRGLHRLAALKMVLAGEFASPAQELRFRLEAELAARVQHPNIVQVYEIGNYHGRPFLALEWVEGGSLANRLDGKPWPSREAAALVVTLARAIHVAHCEGVVHRDLKPANILLQKGEGGRKKRQGESSEPGLAASPASELVPKIADFGLARPMERDVTLTHSGFLVGTPGYMAPEQAGGRSTSAMVGTATDIYALGVVLYELLTGQLPFQGDSTLEVLRAVTSDEPVRPRRLQPRVPRDLEAITLHCLEKQPTRRYPSALALAEDLARFRAGKQVAARPVGPGARLARTCRRRPLVALLLGLLAVSFFGGLAGVTWKWLEANEERGRAEQNARVAIGEKREALFQAYRARLSAAAAAISAHDVVDAARQLDAAPVDLHDWEWRHLRSRLDDSDSVIPLPTPESGLLVPGRDRLRVGILTGDGLRLTDLEEGEPSTVPFSAGGPQVVGIMQTRVGLRVAVWVDSRTFDLLDEAGRRVCRVRIPWDAGWSREVVVSQDGKRLALRNHIAGWSGVGVFDAISGKLLASCKGHEGDAWSLAFSPDGTRVATGGEDSTARVWDAATGALLATCRGHASKVIDLSFSPDGTRLLSTSSDGTVRQWAVTTGGEVEPPYDRHSGDVTAAVYSPDGRWVASVGTDRTVRVWQARGRQDVAVLHGHTAALSGVAFAPDGRRLASISRLTRLGAGEDRTVRGWEVDPRATLPVLRGHTSYVYPVAFSPDGRWIASGGWDKTVRLWDATTGEPVTRPLPHPGVVRCLAYSPDGTWLVTGGDGDDRLRIWDVATARVRKEIQGPGRFVWHLAVSPDGARIAASANEWETEISLSVCDVTSGERLFAADGRVLSYSPDGRWLAVRAADRKTVLLLDALTHRTAARLSGHDAAVQGVAFSPDSRLLASYGRDRTVRLWPIDGGACRELRGHTDEVFAAAFHPDGKRLATAGRDRAVWLWDLDRGEVVARLQGHTSYVWSLAFSPDGATLVSGSGDNTVRLWDTAPLKMRYQARREAEALRPEAERLVESLWRQKHDPAEVVEALRADRGLNEPLRQAALRAVLKMAQPPGAAPGHPPDPP